MAMCVTILFTLVYKHTVELHKLHSYGDSHLVFFYRSEFFKSSCVSQCEILVNTQLILQQTVKTGTENISGNIILQNMHACCGQK